MDALAAIVAAAGDRPLGGDRAWTGSLRDGYLARTSHYCRPILDVVVTRDTVSSDAQKGLAMVPDYQALAEWDALEKRRLGTCRALIGRSRIMDGSVKPSLLVGCEIDAVPLFAGGRNDRDGREHDQHDNGKRFRIVRFAARERERVLREAAFDLRGAGG